MDLSNDLIAALGTVGKLFYDTMKGKIDGGNYPPGSDNERGLKTIPDATTVQSPEKDGENYILRIEIDTSDSGAPYAAAYEWGSGEHKLEGGAEYPIEGHGKYMVWPEAHWPQWEPWPGKAGLNPWRGNFITKSIMHPGVEAKPYITPTVQQIKPEVKKILAREFKVGFLRGGTFTEIE